MQRFWYYYVENAGVNHENKVYSRLLEFGYLTRVAVALFTYCLLRLRLSSETKSNYDNKFIPTKWVMVIILRIHTDDKFMLPRRLFLIYIC